MNKLPDSFEMDKYGLRFRFVKEEDAEFIIQLRTDSRLNRYINKIENNVEAQKDWIRAYKQREREGTDYYFIVFHNLEPCGLIRIYDITNESFTSGSWIFKQNCDFRVPILADIAITSLAYKLFPEKSHVFDVRKENKNVLKYHKSFNPVLIKEDELNYYFMLPQGNFEKGKKDKLKLLGVDADMG